MKNLVVSIHIPKTGGTTFQNLLYTLLENNVVFDYDDKPLSTDYRLRKLNNLGKDADIYRDILTKLSDKPQQIAMVHGHFLASKYDFVFPEAHFITWFRDPVERLVSHYYYWLRRPDRDNALCRKMIEEEMELMDFAKLEQLRNVHYRYISKKSLDAFDFIGITEEYTRSVSLFLKMFFPGLSSVHVVEKNQNPNRNAGSYKIDESIRKAIIGYNEVDTDLYERAKARLNELCESSGI